MMVFHAITGRRTRSESLLVGEQDALLVRIHDIRRDVAVWKKTFVKVQIAYVFESSKSTSLQ